MRKYDRYLDPDAIADSDEVPTSEEIASHSSLLTNRRLDIMFARLDEIRIEAWNNTNIPALRSYFAVLSGIFDNVYPVFEINDNKMIKEYFDVYHQLFFNLFRDPEEVNRFELCYKILLLLDQIHRMLVGFLQQKQFFFRLAKPQIKGIKMALELYEKKRLKKEGENIGVPAMVGSEHESPGEIKEAIPESNQPVPKKLP